MSERQSERGTALIAALLLVALMAAVAVQLMDVTRFAAFRTAQIDQRTQAVWMARGARDLAEAAFLNAGTPGRAVMRSDELWLAGPVVFPLENGQVVGEIQDRNNCLNINALVDQDADGDDPLDSDARTADVQWRRQAFLTLSLEIGVPAGEAEALLAQITDWIDADQSAEPGGAEDRTYGAYAPPYRAANQRFTELEELRALPVMTPPLYAVYQPYLCVLPLAEQPALNINTLALDQSVLLSALLHEELDPADAETLLFRRPPAGYESLEEVWADPLLAPLELSDAEKTRLTLRSRWFEMEVSVRLAETRFHMTELAELNEGGDLRRRSQRFGAF
ncbi:type II secretion system minor pseudopilin GspK [Oceanicaulis sp. LC35]|uniref:type II secretion system minor pseudopilin GspK n=1 Tax=Oceanicaulis sp. LC35 TaxID=3349635 RepID=UPI003F85C635